MSNFGQIEYDEKIYNVKMTREQNKKPKTYFNDSVRRLERLLDRDLAKIWF